MALLLTWASQLSMHQSAVVPCNSALPLVKQAVTWVLSCITCSVLVVCCYFTVTLIGKVAASVGAVSAGNASRNIAMRLSAMFLSQYAIENNLCQLSANACANNA